MGHYISIAEAWWIETGIGGIFVLKLKNFLKSGLNVTIVNGRFLSLHTFIISKIEIIYRNLTDKDLKSNFKNRRDDDL